MNDDFVEMRPERMAALLTALFNGVAAIGIALAEEAPHVATRARSELGRLAALGDTMEAGVDDDTLRFMAAIQASLSRRQE